jgi:hypothetical protein
VHGLLRWRPSRRTRLLLNGGSIVLALAVSAVSIEKLTHHGWPLTSIDARLAAPAGILFILAYGIKAAGWRRLFASHERPRSSVLAAATGAASVMGIALPGRFDDVVRVAVVRRSPGCRSGVGTVCFSLVVLGLIDAAALTPLASTAAATSHTSAVVRAGLAVVAAAGIAAAALVLFTPRIAASRRLGRFRVVHWLRERVVPPWEAGAAWILVLTSWIIRGVALFLLLAACDVALSFPLAIGFLCAGAASAALPVAPAGAATQAGAGAGVLIASGIGAGQAIGFAVAAQALAILAGAAVIVLAALWHAGSRLLVPRPAA